MNDIRKDPDVIRVYCEMNKSRHTLPNKYIEVKHCMFCKATPKDKTVCIQKPIHLSIGDLAFFMRNKCEAQEWERCMALPPLGRIPWAKTNPEQWIRAACAAWSQKKTIVNPLPEVDL